MRVGVPENCYTYFDCGTKRTAADVISGKNRNNVSALCRAAIVIGAKNTTTEKGFDNGHTADKYATNASIIEFYDIWTKRYPGTIEEAIEFSTSRKMKFTKWTPKSMALSALAMMTVDKNMAREFMDAVSDEKDTRDSVLSYRNWSITHDVRNYKPAKRTFIEWCAAANVWKMLHGYEDKKLRFTKNTTPELIGFKPEVFDVLGNHKQQEEEDE